jgi:hypothetical protein
MGAERRKSMSLRKTKSGRTLQRSSKSSEPLWREPMDDDESAQAEEIDRLLLSSLKFWEVERDLIEERLAAKKSVRISALRRPDIAA